MLDWVRSLYGTFDRERCIIEAAWSDGNEAWSALAWRLGIGIVGNIVGKEIVSRKIHDYIYPSIQSQIYFVIADLSI